MLSQVLLLVISTSNVLARGVGLEARAGAPNWRLLPSGCFPLNPLYCATGNTNCLPVQTAPNFRILNTTVQSNQIYAYYLPQNDWPAYGSDLVTMFTRCMVMCYGYASPGDCKAFYVAFNVPAPRNSYNTNDTLPRGPSVACQMFNRTLTPSDFVVSNSTHTNATSGNLVCDGTQAADAGAYQSYAPFAMDVQPSIASLAPSTTSLPSGSVQPITSMSGMGISVSQGVAISGFNTGPSSVSSMGSSSVPSSSVASSSMGSGPRVASLASVALATVSSLPLARCNVNNYISNVGKIAVGTDVALSSPNFHCNSRVVDSVATCCASCVVGSLVNNGGYCNYWYLDSTTMTCWTCNNVAVSVGVGLTCPSGKPTVTAFTLQASATPVVAGKGVCADDNILVGSI